MSVAPIRVLCVDADAGFADMTAASLERDDHFTVLTETDVDGGLARLDEEPIDCIVSDYEMPTMDGLGFLRAVRETRPELPFILFTARGSEDVAEKAIRAGVSSYIQKEGEKSNFTVLANRIENTVSQYRAQQRASQLERKYELVAQTATDAFWTVDPQSNSVTLSDGIEQFGYAPDTDLDREWFFERIHPDDRDRIRQHDDKLFQRDKAAFDELTDDRGQYSVEYRFQREDGTFAECRERGTLLFEDDDPVLMVGTMADITDRKDRKEQLQHYRTLTQTASDAVVRMDTESIIQDVNPAVSGIFGYSPDELIGESITKVMSDDMAEDHLRGLQRYLRDGERSLDWEYIELTGVHADGTEVPVTISFGEYEHGGDHYFTGIIRDITERKAREQKLRETAHRLEAILQTVPSGVFMWDLDGEILLLNEFARKIAGLEGSDEMVEGRPMTGVFPEPLADQAHETQQRVLDAEGVIEVEEEASVAGDTRTYKTLSGPVYDDEGEIKATCGIATDITDQKRRQQDLERETERLERFASVLSHDLRSPVSVAQGYLELAQQEYDCADLDKVEEALHRTDSIIDDVLTLAREGDRVTNTTTVSVQDVAVEAWNSVEHSAATLDMADSPSVQCDRQRVQRLFENLFRNAIEHGESDVTIRVGALAEGDGFYVEDDGPGLPDTDSDRLFEWGYSADDGTGFGLAIVEQIVEAHGWTIAAANRGSGGARFEIELGQTSR
ncbi:PAS domain S-box protein [Natronomonas halophila]|uniref:PAS domain S-box protein n=1 Tax=Natronomonas halophila TaxID=2747817 RepID=UPI0015B78CBB|nr:PAS domain S-box protein [Natronomonas halophila]QLD84371.1 PAS domain S-box protein [Natronomonas halophila]